MSFVGEVTGEARIGGESANIDVVPGELGEDHQAWLCVLAGRAGTGKTTLAKQLSQATGACYLRVDAVETALSLVQEHIGAAGYVVVHEIAASNLLLGINVIVDAVNAVPAARAGWRDTARRCGAQLILLETVLPDADEHRRRVESREADIPGHQVPTWSDVQADGWLPWNEDRDGARVVVDTTVSERALRDAREALSLRTAHTTSRAPARGRGE